MTPVRAGPRERLAERPTSVPPAAARTGVLGLGGAGAALVDGGGEVLDIGGLTRAVGEGDTAAFETLYRAWYERTLNTARALTRRDESFCLDVTQEVMLRVAKKLPPMKVEAELVAWMGRTIVSCAVDLLRRESRRARRERVGAERAGELRDHAESCATHEQLAWAAREIRKLPVVEQSLLVQRFANGCSLKESGLAVGLGEQAAHGRVRRALNKLRAVAQEVWHAE